MKYASSGALLFEKPDFRPVMSREKQLKIAPLSLCGRGKDRNENRTS